MILFEDGPIFFSIGNARQEYKIGEHLTSVILSEQSERDREALPPGRVLGWLSRFVCRPRFLISLRRFGMTILV
jgi:hypothetical protein